MNPIDYSLMYVTDERMIDTKSFLNTLELSLQGGVSIIQLREKTLSSQQFYQRAMAVKSLCDQYHTPLIINDRIDIAIAVNADGVHIGQKDLPVEVARRLLGQHKIIGWSVSNEEQAFRANKLAVDYIGLSPIFNTNTKTCDLDFPLGIEGLKRIKKISEKPIICIGGIDTHNTDLIINHGADGIAVVSAISTADQPKQATITLKNIIHDSRHSFIQT